MRQEAGLEKAWPGGWSWLEFVSHQHHYIMFKEFREFALKGNLIDMAVAFVMGAAFTKLSSSFIEDLIMPLVGRISGGVDFSNKFVALSTGVTATSLVEAKKQAAVLAYGNFVTISINFVIVAFVMFLVVKAINKAKALTEKQAEAAADAAPVEVSAQEKLLIEIRDLLRQRQ
jgi:large conductance mechanosensitive channel